MYTESDKRSYMYTESDKRNTLAKLISHMSDTDAQQMLAYAAGYEAGKISQITIHTPEHSNASPKQMA